jgi:FixJ family two-component response regulator
MPGFEYPQSVVETPPIKVAVSDKEYKHSIIDTKEKEIADKLCISIHTVNIHRQNLLRKLGVQNSIEAIRLGQESGLLG